MNIDFDDTATCDICGTTYPCDAVEVEETDFAETVCDHCKEKLDLIEDWTLIGGDYVQLYRFKRDVYDDVQKDFPFKGGAFIFDSRDHEMSYHKDFNTAWALFHEYYAPRIER